MFKSFSPAGKKTTYSPGRSDLTPPVAQGCGCDVFVHAHVGQQAIDSSRDRPVSTGSRLAYLSHAMRSTDSLNHRSGSPGFIDSPFGHRLRWQRWKTNRPMHTPPPAIPIRDVDRSAMLNASTSPARSGRTPHTRSRFRTSCGIAAVTTTLVLYSIVRGIELLFLRLVQPSRFEVHLISQTILLIALGATIYLWLNLRATRAMLTALERARIVLDTQLSLARDIQQHLLPEIPPRADNARWAVRLEPAGMIGGDFYEFIALDEGLLIVVGDVSGKGIPAALLQTSAHALFRTFARETADPADLLTRVSEEIYAENEGALYLTCLVARLHPATSSFTYVNAGHPAGLLWRASGRQVLDAGGPPAGMFAGIRYVFEDVPLTPGDLGVFVTDGITEAIEQDGVPAVDRLDASICAVPNPRTPERVCDALMDLARDGAGPAGIAEWQDDKTVLAFVIDGDAPASLQASGCGQPSWSARRVHSASATVR